MRQFLLFFLLLTVFPTYAQTRMSTFIATNGTFAFNYPDDWAVISSSYADRDLQRVAIETFQFEFASEFSVVDQAVESVIISNYDGDGLIDGQIIAQVVMNEDFPRFYTPFQAMVFYFNSLGIEGDLVETTYGTRQGMYSEVEYEGNSVLYSTVLLDDDVAVFMLTLSTDTLTDHDDLHAVVNSVFSSMTYAPTDITPLNELEFIIPDTSLITKMYTSVDERFRFQAPDGLIVNFENELRVTIASPEIRDDGLPVYGIEFFVHPIDTFVRQPELLISKSVRKLTDSYIGLNDQPIIEFNLNGRRAVETHGFNDMAGFSVSMLVDNHNFLAMNAIAPPEDIDTIMALARAVASSVEMIDRPQQVPNIDTSMLTQTYRRTDSLVWFDYPEDWVAIQDAGQTYLVNRDDFTFEGMTEDDLIMTFALVAIQQIHDDSTTRTLLEAFSFFYDVELFSLEELTINGMAVAQANSVSGNSIDEYLFVVELPDGSFGLVNAIMVGGALNNHKNMIHSIISTLSVSKR